MPKNDIKSKIQAISNARKSLPKTPSEEIIVQQASIVKKRGRKSTKDPNKTYTKTSVTIEKVTFQRMKVALVSSLETQYKSQDQFINDAIAHYLDHLEN